VDDNFDALLLVLRAVHLQNRLIPFNISAEKLFHVAVVCDKYDLTDSVMPWTEIWIRNFKDVAQTSRYERWLRISWVFQRAEIFEKVTRRLILETEFNPAGNLVTEGGETFTEGIPDSVIGMIILLTFGLVTDGIPADDITTHRHDLIEMLLNLVRGEFDKYRLCVTNETHVCTLPRSSYSSLTTSKAAQCDVISLGTLTKYLMCWNIWPDCQASAWKRSPATLMRSLREMSHYGDAIVYTWSNKGHPKDTHDKCSPKGRIIKAIDTYFTNIVVCCKLPGSESDLALPVEIEKEEL